MKVIGRDNFARENVADVLVCENVNEYFALLIAKLLNKHSGALGNYFYYAVADDTKLWRGMEELV